MDLVTILPTHYDPYTVLKREKKRASAKNAMKNHFPEPLIHYTAKVI